MTKKRMREHLFKGFRELPEGKQIINVDNKEICGEWLTGDVGRKGCISDGAGPFWRVVPETVSECTGQCDRNGKKIFENDICRFYGDDTEFSDYIVRWDRSVCGFVTIPVDEKYKDTDFLDDFFAVKCEVVGDIFNTRVADESRSKD